MRITPHAELEEFARQEYQKHFARIPEPVPVNVEAVVLMLAASANQPRDIVWGTLHYRAPPLSFAQGFRLMVAANALRARRIAGVPAGDARRTALRLIRPILRPRNPLRRLLPAPYMHAPDIAVEMVIRQLIHVPDEGVSPPASRPMRVDLMDEIATLAEKMPAWCGADGQPKSWAHYLYGTRHLAREIARMDLRTAVAVRFAQGDADHWKKYELEQRSAAGWVH